jgi:pSer/pThr/pTyr-binding forkhead associated (FHA) protein
MASIIVVSGPNEGDYYPLGARTMVVGRDEGCPIQITDDRASRKHFQIRFDPATKGWHGLDMKSANGTWINGRKVETDVALQDNDEIMVGESKLVFTLKEFPDRQSALSHWKQRGQRVKPTIEQR